MKRFFTGLALSAIFLATIARAPAVLPHVHGSDFDHSSHKNCPVYFASALGLQAVLTSGFIFAVLFVSLYFLPQGPSRTFVSNQNAFAFLRAPPALTF
jgi:hypothetical protein